jgi:hypothetical protein
MSGGSSGGIEIAPNALFVDRVIWRIHGAATRFSRNGFQHRPAERATNDLALDVA